MVRARIWRMGTVLLWISAFVPCLAQERPSFDEVETWILQMTEERAAQESDWEESDTEAYSRDMMSLARTLYNQPVPLNSCTQKDLERIVWLSPFQIKSLLQYRTEHGRIATVYEIPYILGFDLETAEWLQFFVTAQDGAPARQRTTVPAHTGDMVFTLGRSVHPGPEHFLPDSASGRYRGDEYAGSLRLSLTYRRRWNLYLGADKDAGEPFFACGRHGPDSWSGAVAFSGDRAVQQVVLGNYKIDWGQGLIAGNAFSSGIADLSAAARRHAGGLRPYTSSGETGFLTGAGVTLGRGPWSGSGWVSCTRPDAVRKTADTLGYDAYFTSFSTGGLHRTENEEAHRKQICEQVAGGRLQWQGGRLVAGFTWLGYRFDIPWLPDGKPYRRFGFSGISGSNTGLDFRFSWQQIMGFCEVARCEQGAWAWMGGLQWLWPQNASVTLVHHHYAAAYHSRFGTAAGSSSTGGNNIGWHLGTTLPVPGHWKLHASAGWSRAPWLKYGADAPSMQVKYMLRCEYNPTRQLSAAWQWRWNSSEENRTGSGVSDRMVRIIQHEAKGMVKCCPSRQWTLQSRFTVKHYLKEYVHSTGLMAAQDVTWQPRQTKWQWYGQAAWFCTDDYQSRIYLSERDMLYCFSSAMYYRHGFRAALMLRYSNRRWTVRCKYACTWSPGDGRPETMGDGHKSSIRLQIIHKWQTKARWP